MKKTFYLSSICIALSLCSSIVYADISAQDGFYIDVNGGYSGLMSPRAPTNYNSTTLGTYKVTGNTWSANAGYQWALDTFSTIGWEAGYSEDGQATYNGSGAAGDTGSLQLQQSSIDILATFNTLWSNGFNIFVKAGAAWQTQKANLTGPLNFNGVTRTSSDYSNDHVAPMAELGLGYMITNNLDIYTSVSGTFGNTDNTWAFPNSGSVFTPYAFYRFRVGLSYIF
ncbi:MAG: hypothetical protein K0Q57_371 [Gammaproteobacteria bacterium]|jgi:hypothetical protein|nr:hypothetical protein [Gammaproteobacteria bacterium]